MIEYANEPVIKLLKQYDMLAKSLNYIDDITQKNDICSQMTKIISQVIEITNSIYENKYKRIATRAVYLMEDEKNRLLELINLINERRAYINNQIISNQELTSMTLEIPKILGEDKLEDHKRNVKIIDRYKNNIRMESILKEEIEKIDTVINKATEKINSNKNINRQLEDKMIRIVSSALEKLSLLELKDREKEIDLAYTELGYSLEKAKENAKIARRDCTEDIILECDNILASTTLDYERYKEKKLILRLIYLYNKPVTTYEELLRKREEINNILLNITNSELYSLIGNELNKEYSTIKLEAQDIATLKSLMEEKNNKKQQLREIIEENNSESLKGLLATLLENERKYQEKLEEEKKQKEKERLEREKIEEQKRLEERAKRQKEIEEERNKEIERRTKQLLDEKKNSLIMNQHHKESSDIKKRSIEYGGKKEQEVRKTAVRPTQQQQVTKTKTIEQRRMIERKNTSVPSPQKVVHPEKIIPKKNGTQLTDKNDFFAKENKNQKVTNQGIPVIKNNNVITAKKVDNENEKIFPEIPIEKKKDIFPNISKREENDSFFNENEFNDLSNYVEENKNWF